ncbi:hypothetical protein H5410_047757 [Solanum commersonii]|uniref:DNA-directed RNA polymerase n=1 Tax=Solanum commersonii TaxID=4109 RepID=A0A9J5XG34_SOLCO|nr:hypothetical protein H5410_047757 [Solanum commersonii]
MGEQKPFPDPGMNSKSIYTAEVRSLDLGVASRSLILRVPMDLADSNHPNLFLKKLYADLRNEGKSRILDGRTGNPFELPDIIGKPYILKLIHQVDDKIHGHFSGHYALVTQQPLRGRAKQGGQRMLTYKSDHIRARQEVLGTTIIGGAIPNPKDAPESFRLLVRELRSLALN